MGLWRALKGNPTGADNERTEDMDALLVPIVSGLIGACVGSWLTAIYQVRENKKSAALGLLEVVQEKLGRWRHIDESGLRDEVLRYFDTDGATLSTDASLYLDYLDAIDFLLFAADKKMVDLTDVKPWIRGLLVWDRPDREFIEKLRVSNGDDATLEYLLSHIDKDLKSHKLPKGTTHD